MTPLVCAPPPVTLTRGVVNEGHVFTASLYVAAVGLEARIHVQIVDPLLFMKSLSDRILFKQYSQPPFCKCKQRRSYTWTL